tara:strand:+ start:6253 stop:6387 length:135 start_codon:yes stop_codon:yes gene_type:complete
MGKEGWNGDGEEVGLKGEGGMAWAGVGVRWLDDDGEEEGGRCVD